MASIRLPGERDLDGIPVGDGSATLDCHPQLATFRQVGVTASLSLPSPNDAFADRLQWLQMREHWRESAQKESTGQT